MIDCDFVDYLPIKTKPIL